MEIAISVAQVREFPKALTVSLILEIPGEGPALVGFFRCRPAYTRASRRIPRWEHEHLLDAVQQRLDANPLAMRQRRETVEHPFGTIKARMGATHFLTRTLPKIAAEMALTVLAYNLTRVMNIVGTKPLVAAISLRPNRSRLLADFPGKGVFTRPRP